MNDKNKIGRAWVIELSTISKLKKYKNKILYIFDWRKSERQIMNFLEQIYVNNFLSKYETISFIKNGYLPYPLKTKIGDLNYEMIIGHDPELKAFQVQNLTVERIFSKKKIREKIYYN